METDAVPAPAGGNVDKVVAMDELPLGTISAVRHCVALQPPRIGLVPSAVAYSYLPLQEVARLRRTERHGRALPCTGKVPFYRSNTDGRKECARSIVYLQLATCLKLCYELRQERLEPFPTDFVSCAPAYQQSVMEGLAVLGAPAASLR